MEKADDCTKSPGKETFTKENTGRSLKPTEFTRTFPNSKTILDTIERHEKPKAIRTDNESVFTSRLFRFGLWLPNIKHQRTEVCCPWMNGKIERFFGTLKNKLRFYTITNSETIVSDLAAYRFWYNHVRTHQHLNGQTPAEVWSKTKLDNRSKAIEFSVWDGVLAGIYFYPP